MRFIDEVSITVSSGSGGDGCVSFRREKYVPRGGPDGGDGGDGGSVYIMASGNLNTLVNYRGKKFYKAQDGRPGEGRQKNGRYGKDETLLVPVGTLVRDRETAQLIADLSEDGQRVLIAEGGRGGLGNINFKSSTNQTPLHAQTGRAGSSLELELELRLLADIALVGLPNAGKSTLISAISAARPKIADYPFTTLEPNLGVVSLGDNSFVVADIPGLIEDASRGKGLGFKFLRHIRRCRTLVHLVDISWCLNEYEALEQYVTIRQELEKYSPKLAEKRELICLSKVDALDEKEVEKFCHFFREQLGQEVLPISAVSGRNLKKLKALLWRQLEAIAQSDHKPSPGSRMPALAPAPLPVA